MVSVIIAAYNCADTISEALDSALAQTVEELEVVVVDDGSTDGTAAVIEPYLADRRVRLHRQANQGPAAARNAGIERSSGAYVSMLDSDDLWLPRYLETMVAALERDPEAGFAFTRAWVLERASNRFKRRPWPWSVPESADASQLLEALIEHNFILNSVTLRHEALTDAGAYDPALSGAEDYELWLRLAARGYRAVYVPGPLCIVSDRPGARHHEHDRVFAGLRQVYCKLLDMGALSHDASSQVRARVADIERHAELAKHRGMPLRARSRRAGAALTHQWRARRARLPHPPAEVSTSFPRLGVGTPPAGRADTGGQR